jgi:hypothetical protein
MKMIAMSLLAISTAATLSASGRTLPIPDRAKGAEVVVVATVMEVIPAFERNSYGDQLIISHTLLQVEEALKGRPPLVLSLDVEGGTIGDLTLSVSDMETIAKGDRGVFFVTRSTSGANVPHQRGNGVVKLDANNRVRGTSTTLDEVKRLVKQGVQ